MRHLITFFIAVDPSKWLQTPTGEVEVFDDDSLDQSGWFPEANLAGIACESLIVCSMYLNSLSEKI